jgi:hypothetical protein
MWAALEMLANSCATSVGAETAAKESVGICAQRTNITPDDILSSGVIVEFIVSDRHLCQTHESIQGQYVAITWPNILPPAWACDLTLQQALIGISTNIRLPEVCINQ